MQESYFNAGALFKPSNCFTGLREKKFQNSLGQIH